MEIERKYLIKELPDNISDYDKNEISQGYLSVEPVVRIRRMNDNYYLTIKSSGLISRIEVEKNITKDEFNELKQIVKGNLIEKTRYNIPYNGYTLEIDEFHGLFEGLKYGEVEFPDVESSQNFTPPGYFLIDVTESPEYQNSSLSNMIKDDISDFIENVFNKLN